MRAHHSMTDGLEDLREAELGNEQAEGAPALLIFGKNVCSGSGAARNKAHALKVVNSLGDGNAGGVEELAKFGLTRKTVARLERTGLNAGKQVIEDTAMLR